MQKRVYIAPGRHNLVDVADVSPAAVALPVIAPAVPCGHRGLASGETIECPSCPAAAAAGKKTRLKTFACAKFGVCVLAGGGDVVASCDRCPEHTARHPAPESAPAALHRELSAPWTRVRIDEHRLPGAPGLRFNCSLLPYQDGYLFAFRNGWGGSEVFVVRMDAEFRPHGAPVQLRLHHATEASYGREDPRLFWFRGRVHVAYIGVVSAGGRIDHTSVLYARLDANFRVERVFYPHFPARNHWEKNWSFFEWQHELYAVYSVAPHKVLHVDGERAELVYETPMPAPWDGGECRGGASPVLVGEEFYHFFHDRVGPGQAPTYRMGLYTFDAAPPFGVRRFLPAPILSADPRTKPADQYAAVVFPGGAVRHGSDWIVACGVHDRWSELHRFDAAALERQLVPIVPPRWWSLVDRHSRLCWEDIVGHDGYHLAGVELHAGDLVVDVGANVGSFSYLALSRGADVIAVEPVPANVEVLRRNLLPWRCRVHIAACAVSDREGTIRLGVPAQDGLGSLHWREVDWGTVEAPCRTLAQILDEAGAGDRKIRLLKLDCEGGEWAVLQSADLSRVERIVGEYHWRRPGEDAAELRRLLTAAGFTVGIGPDEGARVDHFFAYRR